MNILIDIGHPAHVHMFKHFAHEMIRMGNSVLFTTQDKEFEKQLLKNEGFQFVVIRKKHKSVIRKIIGTLHSVIRCCSIAHNFKPDVFLSHGSIIAALSAFILRVPNIALEDTYNMEQVRLYAPFSDVIITSDYQHGLTTHKKNLSLALYHALLYLHPKRFSCDDGEIKKELGLNAGERYVVVRFIAWMATHDIGHKGISLTDKMTIVTELSRYAKVFISSETPLPVELEPYRLKLPPEKIHAVEANAALLFSEGSTMVEEAAMLGVPAIYVDNSGRVYTDQLERKYGLCYTFAEKDIHKALKHATLLMQMPEKTIKAQWAEKRQKMLSEHIDPTAFLVWFMANYPQSETIIRENPEYQWKFK